MTWLLRGGTLVDPESGWHGPADLLIAGDRIVAVAPHLDPEPDWDVEDVSGLVVAPGFIDMHVHLREPGQVHKEDIASGGRAAVRGGFVAVCAMPNTSPPIDDEAGVRFVLDRGRAGSPARVYPVACITRGLEGVDLVDMAALAAAGAVAFSDDGRCVMNAEVMRRALEQAHALGRPLLLHEEDHPLTAGGSAHEGDASRSLGLRGMPALAEDVMVARDILMAEAVGAHIHIAHISTARSVALVREARARGVRVTAEVTPHHLVLDDEALSDGDTCHKMNPPLRTAADREALIEGLRDGTIDAIATDHAPHSPAEKAVDFARAPFGVIGLETAVPVVFDVLVRTGRIPLDRFVDALSRAPARIVGLDLGRVAVGGPACLTVLDLDATETIDAARFESRSRNCPFVGRTVRGLPVMTVVDGHVVMRARECVFPPGAASTGDAGESTGRHTGATVRK